MRRLISSLAVFGLMAAGIVGIGAGPAAASECNVIPAMNLYTMSNGEAGCGKVVVTHIRSDPNHFWLSWYVQDVVDYGSDADNTTLGFKWSANSNGGYLGSDINSADYVVNSGYSYLTVPIGGINNIRGTLTVHGVTMTTSLPAQHEWIN